MNICILSVTRLNQALHRWKRMQKNLLNLPKSSCKRSPQYLPHTHSSASKRHWTPQPFLLAKQDESRSTQTELDGLKVFQQIHQFPHITGIYRSCCSLQSVFDAICSAKEKVGVRERGTCPMTCLLSYIHLLDVFSLVSKGVWQQAGLQHIGFAAHVCRSFELVFSWMFFVCLSAAVSCVYGLGGKRVVIYSTKDMFNVKAFRPGSEFSEAKHFQSFHVSRLPVLEAKKYILSLCWSNQERAAACWQIRQGGATGQGSHIDGMAMFGTSEDPGLTAAIRCFWSFLHLQATCSRHIAARWNIPQHGLAVSQCTNKQKKKWQSGDSRKIIEAARPNIGIKAIETVGNLGKPLRPYGWSNILRQALEHKAICLRFQHEGLCSIFFSHLQT